jgi:hypothetical protein
LYFVGRAIRNHRFTPVGVRLEPVGCERFGAEPPMQPRPCCPYGEHLLDAMERVRLGYL